MGKNIGKAGCLARASNLFVDIAVKGSNVCVPNIGMAMVNVFDTGGQELLSFGESGSGNGQFSPPEGVAVDSQGNIYITDRDNHRVQKFDSNGTYLSQFGSQPGELQMPSAVVLH